MLRSVSCRIDAQVSGHTELVLSIAPSIDATLTHETLAVTHDGRPRSFREVLDHHGTRLHVVGDVGPGRVEVVYGAVATGQATAPTVAEAERIRYLRPSRYCEADQLAGFARTEFSGLTGLALLRAVSSWVGTRVAYVAGASRFTDGAVATLLSREGVCRDFAHLVIAMLRSCETPARLASVYAPGLTPMDFHAVAEVAVGDQWLVVDPTCLAPRGTMLRIATGRDAADTAFLTSIGGSVELLHLEVGAVVEGELPTDDVAETARLG